MGLQFLIFKPLKTKLLAFVEAFTFTGKTSASFFVVVVILHLCSTLK